MHIPNLTGSWLQLLQMKSYHMFHHHLMNSKLSLVLLPVPAQNPLNLCTLDRLWYIIQSNYFVFYPSVQYKNMLNAQIFTKTLVPFSLALSVYSKNLLQIRELPMEIIAYGT